MVVSVTASTTQGAPLQPEVLQRATDACVMAIELHEMRATIMAYVESRMSLISPNVSILLGASTAAKIMGSCFYNLPIRIGEHVTRNLKLIPPPSIYTVVTS